jgi:hypothetical protein
MSESNKTEFKMSSREVGEQIAMLKETSYNVARGLQDELLARQGKLLGHEFTPGQQAQAHSWLRQSVRGIDDRFAQAPNGIARAAHLEVMRQYDVLQEDVWVQALLELERKRALIPPGKGKGLQAQRKAVADEFYATAIDRLAPAIRAVNDVLDDVYAMARRMDVDPAQDAALTANAVAAYGQMRRVRATPAEGLFAIKPGRRAAADTMHDRLEDLRDRIIKETTAVTAVPGHFTPQDITVRLRERIGELNQVRQGLPASFEYVTPEGQGALLDIRNWLTSGAKGALGTRDEMENALERVWTQFNPGATMPRLTKDLPLSQEDILQHINRITQQIPGEPVVKDQLDLLDVIRRHSGEDYSKLLTAVQHYPGADVLIGNPLDAAADKAIRQMASRFGIGERNWASPILDSVKLFNAFYRESALATFTYTLVNATGALLNNTLTGLNPVSGMRYILRGMAKSVQDPEKYQPATHIADLMSNLGERPTGAARGFASGIQETQAESTRQFLGVDRPAWQQIGRPLLTGGGAAIGGTSGYFGAPEDATPQERAALIGAGAASGATLFGIAHPLLATLTKRLGTGVEDAARGELWWKGTLDQIARQQDDYKEIVLKAFGPKQGLAPGTLYPSTRGTGKGLLMHVAHAPTTVQAPTGNVDTVLNFVERAKYQMTPEAISRLLVEYGADPARAHTAGREWRVLNRQANHAGQDLAAHVQFDYEHLSNLEQFMREFTPFSTWAFKALPFFARHMLEKPIILQTLMEYYQTADRLQKEQGLSSRTGGAVPQGFFDEFWARFLGYPVYAYINPFRGLLPFANSAQAAGFGGEDETFLQQFNRALTVMGLPEVSAPVQTIARNLGVMSDEPPQGLIRLSGPFQGLTSMLGVNRGRGINLNLGLEGPERAWRENVLRQEVANPVITSAMSKVDELFLRQYRKPISEGGADALPYIQAKAEQKGPIWDEAMRRVSNERGLRSLVAFVYGPAAPQTFTTPEEEAIRLSATNIRVLNPQFSRQIATQAERDPKGQASPEAVQSVREASEAIMLALQGDTALPDAVERKLQAGTWANLNDLRKQMFEVQRHLSPLSGGYGQTGGPEEATLQNLLAWQENLPEGIPGGRQVEALLESHGVPGTFQSAGRPQARVPEVLNPTLKAIQGQREALQGRHPILKAYLEWKTSNPEGSIESFMRQYRAGR